MSSRLHQCISAQLSRSERRGRELVNAVVNAYWKEVVQKEMEKCDTRQRDPEYFCEQIGRDPYQAGTVETELEALGMGDDQTIPARQLAMTNRPIQGEYQRIGRAILRFSAESRKPGRL